MRKRVTYIFPIHASAERFPGAGWSYTQPLYCQQGNFPRRKHNSTHKNPRSTTSNAPVYTDTLQNLEAYLLIPLYLFAWGGAADVTSQDTINQNPNKIWSILNPGVRLATIFWRAFQARMVLCKKYYWIEVPSSVIRYDPGRARNGFTRSRRDKIYLLISYM